MIPKINKRINQKFMILKQRVLTSAGILVTEMLDMLWIRIVVCVLLLTLPVKGQCEYVINSTENILLAKGIANYIHLVGDTAYFKFRQPEKPSYFTCFDTLIRRNSTSYSSDTKDLSLVQGRYVLKIKASPGSDTKEVIFNPASKKQVKQWNYAYNIDLYNSIHVLVTDKEKFLCQMQKNVDSDRLKNEWEALLQLTDEMDPASFQTKMELFMKKFGLK